MMRKSFLLALALVAATAAACKQDASAPSPDNAKTTPAGGGGRAAALRDPTLAKERAPDVFKAQITTSKGDFVIEVHREWAPNGADRFYNLIKIGYYDDVRFFRVVDGFMAQFGIHGTPDINSHWRVAKIPDDPVKQTNKRGFVTFAMAGPASRTSQVFINLVDNDRLDPMGFAPFGQVVSGMEVVDQLYKGYGEGAPKGQGPVQPKIQFEGNTYLEREFPKLDWIKSTKLL